VTAIPNPIAVALLVANALETFGAPHGLFVSPDGQWIGLVDGVVLKKVAMTGGPAITLATLDTAPRGATWDLARATAAHRRAALDRGAEAARAGEINPKSQIPKAKSQRSDAGTMLRLPILATAQPVEQQDDQDAGGDSPPDDERVNHGRSLQ
jgi:hypothetical protein